MNTKFINNLIISLMLGLLAASAFFIRVENFKNSPNRTIDEAVYFLMAKQVNQNVFDYNTIPYGHELRAQGRDHLPSYFFAPLFKHPPVFTYLVAASLKMFGNNFLSAGYVSIFLGVLMIPLIYLLGASAYNRIVGMTAAVFLWLDPVSIISSQKVWMDTTIAFFTLLAALFFSYGLRKNNGWYFILSGLSSGLAFNTKYSGLLIVFAILLFVFFYRKDLFGKRMFRISLILPFLLLIPWILWNLSVYDINAVEHQQEVQKLYNIFVESASPLLLFLIFFSAVFFLVRKIKSGMKKDVDQRISPQKDTEDTTWVRYVSYGVVLMLVVVLLGKAIPLSLSFSHFPVVSWSQGVVSKGLPTFYFTRLLEFFPIYLFAFVSLFLFRQSEDEQNAFIRLSASVILLFFIAWGNYQSRYILSAIPFLLLLAAELLHFFFLKISGIRNSYVRIILMSLLIVFVVSAVSKVLLVNSVLSFPNDMCYF